MSTTGMWEELFAERRWRVAAELTGIVHADGHHEGKVLVAGAPVTFDKGAFELPAGCAYQSVLSTNKARRGIMLQETSQAGDEDIPGSRIALGAPAVKRAREVFGAVWST